MRHNIISPGVGARQCRAPTGVSHVCRLTTEGSTVSVGGLRQNS
ncbi:MAG: hypothetical protein RM021_014245 [Nostoc sp. EkiNYC01]|nr:hypothetical protein [Nostoc sp. EkiNYC01]